MSKNQKQFLTIVAGGLLVWWLTRSAEKYGWFGPGGGQITPGAVNATPDQEGVVNLGVFQASLDHLFAGPDLAEWYVDTYPYDWIAGDAFTPVIIAP